MTPEPPPAWTLAAWQSSPIGSSTGCSWKCDSSPQMMWDKAATVMFRHLRAWSMRSRRWWQSLDPANMVSSGHKLVVNRLMANTHSIQITHPLNEGTGTLEAVFTEHCEECVFLLGCGLSRSFCWLPWFHTSSGSLPQEDVIKVFLPDQP